MTYCPSSEHQGQSEQYYDSPVLSKEWGWGAVWRAQFFFGPGVSVLVAEWLLAWVRKHVSHLYNKWDNLISLSFCSLHYSKRKVRKISVFCQLFPKWSVTDGSHVPIRSVGDDEAVACSASNPGGSVVAKHTGSCNDLPLPSATLDNKSRKHILHSSKLPEQILCHHCLAFLSTWWTGWF